MWLWPGLVPAEDVVWRKCGGHWPVVQCVVTSGAGRGHGHQPTNQDTVSASSWPITAQCPRDQYQGWPVQAAATHWPSVQIQMWTLETHLQPRASSHFRWWQLCTKLQVTICSAFQHTTKYTDYSIGYHYIIYREKSIIENGNFETGCNGRMMEQFAHIIGLFQYSYQRCTHKRGPYISLGYLHPVSNTVHCLHCVSPSTPALLWALASV